MSYEQVALWYYALSPDTMARIIVLGIVVSI